MQVYLIWFPMKNMFSLNSDGFYIAIPGVQTMAWDIDLFCYQYDYLKN